MKECEGKVYPDACYEAYWSLIRLGVYHRTRNSRKRKEIMQRILLPDSKEVMFLEV